ncbi:MAG: carboxypeptidase-like regulatory domain-containing protein [Planctomycetota bacterium]
MTRNLLLLLLIGFALPGCCVGKLPFTPFCAQETTGEVIDAETGEPIPGAQVTLSAHIADLLADGQPVHRSTRTDREGRFRLRHPDVDGLSLFVVADGYHARRVERGYFSTTVELSRPEASQLLEEQE